MSTKLIAILATIAICLKLCASGETYDDGLCSATQATQKCSCRQTTNMLNMPTYTADCSRSSFDSFPKSGQLPEILDDLNLSHNRLTVLANDTIFPSKTLRKLDLSYNAIQFVSTKSFAMLPNLIILDMSHNEITDIDFDAFFNMYKLQTLNIAFNKLVSLPYLMFRPMKSIQLLDMSYNNLGPFFEDADLFGNVHLGLSKSIVNLEMEGIGIVNVTSDFFVNVESLKRLILANNPIKLVPEVPKTVTYLDLSRTQISSVYANVLNYSLMHTLKLNKLMYLDSVPDYAFSNLTSLRHFELSGCHSLKELNPLVFGDSIENGANTTLRRLSLARNGFTTLHDSFYKLFEQLDEIRLDGNPWSCDCDLIWLQNLNTTIHTNNNLRCYLPWYMRNKLFLELTQKELSCFNGNSSIQKALLPIFGSLAAVLLVLIGVLLYMSPRVYKNYFNGIGKESPYYSITVRPATISNT